MADITRLINEWQSARLALQEIERSEHPDITDRYGRVWAWKSKDLYVHDGCLAFPEHMIQDLGLPSPVLASNPNYRLCEICTKEWARA